MAENFSPRRCRPGLPVWCVAKRRPGLPFGCGAKRSAEILASGECCLQRRVYNSSFIRQVCTEYVKL
ncbi:hypothetical protein Taro_043773 [Colocasia esculenta]|uniref:Uncharacterized protein n=1 Tax=Colocasia esculenta TaxID=4460 RepID=A0A843WSX1_COLES|nr:hypothetical protein [Colocasia esculenta]